MKKKMAKFASFSTGPLLLCPLLAIGCLLSAAGELRAEEKGQGFSDIKAAVAELKKVYALDIDQMLTPPDKIKNPIDPQEFLHQHHLISKKLFQHVSNMGGLDFDILLSAQDWDKSWIVSFSEPKKNGSKYTVIVTLKRPNESTTETWTFITEKGAWVASDILYAEPKEKPFTLSSLKEGD